MISVPVTRTSVRVGTDQTRVITKPFMPDGDLSSPGRTRVDRVLARILAMDGAEVAKTLATTLVRFEGRHLNLRSTFEASFAAVAGRVERVQRAGELSAEHRLLIGAYFTHEYSIESAAASNPSLVVAPDQSGLQAGELRFVMSLRAIGEGHFSSIEFRSGVIDALGGVRIEAPSRYARTARHRAPVYDRHMFRSKLEELDAFHQHAEMVLDALPAHFTMDQLEAELADVNRRLAPRSDIAHATRTIHWLASSNYDSSFPVDSDISERVIFPAAPIESHGMEDARFVRFTHDDGTVTYFATYTAYDGHQILPQLIETPDFLSFRIATLNGASARNKGIALFPRMIDGQYAALSRIDNENNFLMRSENVRFWRHSQLLQAPTRPWELMQLGNCGSPIETEAGWLVITHGVGPMRQYALGVILLDKEDPLRVIGHLDEPLLEPDQDERDGYVPNVVYSCGSMIANGLLVLPYGVSDVGTRIATVRLDDLLGELTRAR